MIKLYPLKWQPLSSDYFYLEMKIDILSLQRFQQREISQGEGET